MSDNRKGYKAFGPGLMCQGRNFRTGKKFFKQYEENTEYEENGSEICSNGMMHYCVNPFEVLNYYPLVNSDGQFSEFATVEALAEPVTDDNKKFATSKIKIGAKLGLDGFVKACVDFLYEKTIKDMPGDSVGNGSSGVAAKIGSSGDAAQIGSSGDTPRSAAQADTPRSAAQADTPRSAAQAMTRWLHVRQILQLWLALENEAKSRLRLERG